MTPIVCHNHYHIGDCLISCHLLRALAKANPERVFWFFLNANVAAEVAPSVADIRNIELFSFESEQWHENQRRSLDMWKNAGDFWVNSKFRWDWSNFTLWHHRHMAGQLGFRSPFTIREDLLFDYPALNPNNVGGTYFFDFLVINSEPCSGQFGPMREHGSGYLDDFVKALSRKFKVITTTPVRAVECTRDSKQSITDIGRLSLLCRNHIMIATGPCWTTMNTTNHHHAAGRKRIVLLDNGEQLNLPGITQCATLAEVEKIAKDEKWI